MLSVTQLGTPAVIAPFIAVVGVILLQQRRAYDAIFLIVVMGGAALLNQVLKALFQQARPSLWTPLVVESSYSFTSGYATASFASAMALIILAWHTRWRWAVVIAGGIFALLVGLSRIYLGVHFPSDVLAAWCMTLAWVSLA